MASRRAKARQGEPPRPGRTMAAAAAEIYRPVRTVDLEEITIVESVQVRVGGLDEARVEQYARFLLEGGAFRDPIVLFRDDMRLILSAGFHRCEAYRRASERFVPTSDLRELALLQAEIREGGQEAAVEFAEEDNLAHGLELRAQDKRNILARRWDRGHPWQRLSNRALAAKLGVDEKTVRRWREELEGDSPAANAARERVGKDGKTYDIRNIQAANERRAEERESLARMEQAREARRARGTHFNLRPEDEQQAILDDVSARILAALAGGPRIAVDLRAHIGSPEIHVFWLAFERLKSEGRIQQVPGGNGNYRLAEQAPPATRADEETQQPQPAGPADVAVPEISDVDLAQKLNELLRVGDMVAGHLERLREKPGPLPEWLPPKLNALAGLLNGRKGRDADIWDPGLVELLGDLYAKMRREGQRS